MPSLELRDHDAGEIIIPDWGNYVDQTLLLMDVRLTELTLELALQGLAPDFISLYYDLFSDTSFSDAGVLTADLDVADGTLHLPVGWTQDVAYVYQTTEKTMEYSAVAAHMLIRHNGSIHATITPKLSVIVSGAHSFVAGTLLDSRSTVATLGVRTDPIDNEAYTDDAITTAYMDTAASLVRLPGGASDAWAAETQGTFDAVMQIDTDGASTTNNAQVATCFLPDGRMAILYTSKEYNASFVNYRLRIVKEDGTYVSWGGQDYVNVTTAASSDLHSGYTAAIACNEAGTKLGVLYRNSTGTSFNRIDLIGGTLDTPFTVLASSSHARMVKEVGTDNVWCSAVTGASTTFSLFQFNMTSATGPGSAKTGTMGGSYVAHDISLDQENDVHVAYHDGTNIRYNIWDQSGAAWLYTFNAGDKTFACATTVGWKRDTRVVADTTQTASNKRGWVVYAKDNGAVSSIYMRDITAGVVGSEVVIKNTAAKNFRWIGAFQDTQSSLIHITYCNITDAGVGLLANTCSYTGGTLGSEDTLDTSSIAAANWPSVNAAHTKAIIAWRDGADDATGSEMYFSTKNLGYSLETKIFQSTIYTVPQQATKFLLSTTQVTPTGTTLTWQVSANNGGSWDTATPGVVGTFTTPGTQLLVKATLDTTDVDATPEIDLYSLKALLAATEDTYEWTGLVGTKVKAQLNIESDDAITDTVLYDWGAVLS